VIFLFVSTGLTGGYSNKSYQKYNKGQRARGRGQGACIKNQVSSIKNQVSRITSDFRLPTKALVFVGYNNSSSFIFEEVGKKEALRLLLKEIWVNPQPENVTRFFEWMEKTPFYRLQYSQTNEALEVAEKLFADC